jgi:DNA-binding NarL/FixJ family response regulator
MKRVLIVDDSSSWRMFHKNSIDEVFIEAEIDEYEIDVAASAREGYDLLLQSNDKAYDLIISDLQMEEDFAPKYAGEWFVEQIRGFKAQTNCKVVVCSGCYNIKQISEGLGADYIPKRTAVNDINLYKSKMLDMIRD